MKTHTIETRWTREAGQARAYYRELLALGYSVRLARSITKLAIETMRSL